MDETASVFLVRVWQHRGGARAAVVTVGSESRRWFTDAQALGEHLLGGPDREPLDATGADDDRDERRRED